MTDFEARVNALIHDLNQASIGYSYAEIIVSSLSVVHHFLMLAGHGDPPQKIRILLALIPEVNQDFSDAAAQTAPETKH